VHLTGTTAFTLTPAERRSLVEFTVHGGTLVIDSAGGSSQFADSAEKELAIMFGDGAAKPLACLPPGSLLYTWPDAPIGSVRYRRFARRCIQSNLRVPRIEGIESRGRYVVFFSREDLSAGLVGEQVDGIVGYDPNSATALVRNMILYSAATK
jgi:hypothetical protein